MGTRKMTCVSLPDLCRKFGARRFIRLDDKFKMSEELCLSLHSLQWTKANMKWKGVADLLLLALTHSTGAVADTVIITMALRLAYIRAASQASRRLTRTSVPLLSRLNETNAPNRSMASMAAGNALNVLAEEHPTMDAVRYDWKNVKWTFEHVDYFSEALATGIIETGIAPGDVVLSWLPQHFSEQASNQLLTKQN